MPVTAIPDPSRIGPSLPGSSIHPPSGLSPRKVIDGGMPEIKAPDRPAPEGNRAIWARYRTVSNWGKRGRVTAHPRSFFETFLYIDYMPHVAVQSVPLRARSTRRSSVSYYPTSTAVTMIFRLSGA